MREWRDGTYQAFARDHARDDTAAGHPLEDVVAVPGHQVSVIDHVLLSLLQLPIDQPWPHIAAWPYVRPFG